MAGLQFSTHQDLSSYKKNEWYSCILHPCWLLVSKDPAHIKVNVFGAQISMFSLCPPSLPQVGGALGQGDLVAQESGPLLPSVLPAPEVNQLNRLPSIETSDMLPPPSMKQPCPRQRPSPPPWPLPVRREAQRTRRLLRSPKYIDILCVILFLNASSYCVLSYLHLSPSNTSTHQMATNYLKAQFAMPHHTVPTLEDTLQVANHIHGPAYKGTFDTLHNHLDMDPPYIESLTPGVA